MAQYSIYDIIALLVSIMLPPLGVVMKRGFNVDFWINIILTLLGWLPGLFHAFYVIFKYRDESNSGEGRPIFGGTRPETVKIHSTTQPTSKHSHQPHQPQYQPHQPQYQPQYQPQSQPQSQPQYHSQYQQHSYPKDKGSVVKDAQKSSAGFSNEEVSQAYPPTYGNHGKDEKLEGQSNAYYTDYDDKKRHQ